MIVLVTRFPPNVFLSSQGVLAHVETLSVLVPPINGVEPWIFLDGQSSDGRKAPATK